MGKKGKGPTGKSYVSKGQRPNVTASVRKGMKRDNTTELDREINRIAAWRSGKRAYVTTANANDKETAKKFIRRPAEAVYGDHREAYFRMKARTTDV